MIYIYHSDDINLRRLEYVATHLFKNILEVDFALTSDKVSFLQQSGPCINYSREDLRQGLWIVPQGLLSESGVNRTTEPHLSRWDDLFCFFAQNEGDLPFDLFSATFYLLTLYEEYFPEEPDKHGRFPHKSSLLYKNQVLEVPVVDRWAYRLKEEWKKRGVNTSAFALRRYRYISTFDIDHPYLYKNKSLLRTAGGLARDILHFRGRAISQRLSVLSRLSEDPYFRALQYIEQVHQDYGIPYTMFILIGEQTRYDRHTRRTPKNYYAYLESLQDVTLGLHPSYNTLADLGLLHKEKAELEEVSGRTITSSRQHFLRMRVPDTYRNLLQAGIKEDYTLTFAQAPGFRAGTAIPFRFYDLERDEATDLVFHPTAYMDSTFVFNKEHTPEATLSRMKRLIDEVKRSGGDCVALWHNSNLAGSKTENPWVSVFEESMKYGLLQENN